MPSAPTFAPEVQVAERGDGRTLADREPVPVPRSQVSVKTVATATAVVLGVAFAAWLVAHSLVAITLVVASSLLAVALNRGVELLRRHGVGRRTAIALVMAGFLAVIAGILWLVAPTAVRQVQDLAQKAPEYWEQVQKSQAFAWANERLQLEQRMKGMQGGGAGQAQQVGKAAVSAVGGVLAGLVAVVTVLFVTVFMLAFGGPLVRRLLAEALPAHRERYERVLGKVYRSIGGYLNGLGLIAVLNTALTSTFLAIVGVPFFLPLGILSGLGSLIPLLGATLAGVILALVALASGGLWAGVAVAIYVVVYQQFENHAVAPLVYRRTVRINPLVTLLGIIFLTELAGIIGAFLAVPIMAAAQIILRELLLVRREHLNLPLKGDVAEVRWRPFWKRRPA